MLAFSFLIGSLRSAGGGWSRAIPGPTARLSAALTAAAALATGPLAPAAVYLEDSPDAAQRARQAQDHLDAGRPGEAAALLQSVRLEFGPRLMEREPGLYVDAARWVGLRLRDDPVLRAAYRQRFDDEAEQARGAARDQPDPLAALAAAAQRYAGAGPGRDAALDLAARHVRAGRGLAATQVLNELAHLSELTRDTLRTPLEPHAAVRYWTLAAWAAALRGDAADRDAALGKLATHAGPGPAAELAKHLVAPAPATRSNPASGPLLTDGGPTPRPLWRVTLAQPDPKPRPSASYNSYARSGTPAQLRPVARGDLILANDTQRVYALDAVSGRLRWSHTPPANAKEPAPEDAWRGGGVVHTLPDARSVAADANPRHAFAVLGPVQSVRGRRGPDPTRPASVLVCLDIARGQALWTARPADVDAVVARASFHGTPLLTADLVIVAARRSQPSSFQDSYLVAFDRATGALRWRRHVASTQVTQLQVGGQSRNTGGTLSGLSLAPDRERVYFCDNLGAAAALDAATGAVRWLRVFDTADDHNPAPHLSFTPLTPDAAPVPVRGGVLLPVSHGNALGLLLDADTGRTRKALSAPSPLDGLTRLRPLPGGDLLIAAADQTVRRLNGADLTPTWVHRGAAAGMALAGERIWLLDKNGQLTGLDAASGTLQRSATLNNPGSLVPVEHGVVTVNGRSFASYTPWSAAYATLQERAAQHPGVPEIGLSIATLALNAAASAEAHIASDARPHVNEPPPMAQAVLRGIDHTLRTLDTPHRSNPANRTHTLDALLALTERAGGTLSRTDLDRIFDRLAGAARSPHELLSYTLARAGAATRDARPAQAADFYQAVLDNDTLASGRVHRLGVARRGGVVARQALQELIARSGPAVYAAHARRAADALAQLDQHPGTHTPGPYLALAHRYPLGAPAAQALLRAGRLQSAGAAPAAAATTLRRSHQLSMDDTGRIAAASALAHHYIRQHRPAAAARWLTQVHRDTPQLQLIRGPGDRATPAAWAAALAHDTQAPARPQLTLPLGPAFTLPGRLLTARTTPHAGASANTHMLLRGPDAETLALYDAASPAAAQWRIKDDDRDNIPIDLGPDSVVLWSADKRHVTVRAMSDGAKMFPPVSTELLLAELGAGGRIAAARRATAGASIEIIEADFGSPAAETRAKQARLHAARDTPPTVVAGEAAVAIVDAVGRAAAFDRYTGTALWHLELSVESVQWTRVADGLLLIGGLRGAGTGAESGIVQILDLTTGHPHLPDLEAPTPPLWSGIGPRGNVLILRGHALSAHDPGSGAVRWRAAFNPLVGPTQVRVTPDTLVATDGSRLVAINLTQGSVTGQTAALTARSRLLTGGHRVLLNHDRAGLTALGADAKTAWRSAVATRTPSGPVSITVLDGAVCVAVPSSAERTATVELFRLDLATGRITDRQLTGLPAQRLGPGHLTVIDNALLLSNGQQTLMAPGAASPR